MGPEVLVIGEHNGGEIEPITLDLVSWGCQLAAENKWQLGIVLLGLGAQQCSSKLTNSGADVIFVSDGPEGQQYSTAIYRDTIASIVKEKQPRLVLFGHSYFGIEIAGSIAVILQSSLLSNCLSIHTSDNGFAVVRPIFGGGLLMRAHLQSHGPVMVSMQRGASASRIFLTKLADVVPIDVDTTIPSPKLKLVHETLPSLGSEITNAKVLVAVGRGIGQESKLSIFRELAEQLEGSIAASRPVVDLGWLPSDRQVGLSGQTVKPNVYLAFGISGAAQHIAGMREAALIIAVNKDPDAPIFGIAHYGVISDLFDVATALLKITKAQK
jgi:electron transfer flavoprotein alpha subunit